jgi:hypothetical protein
MSTRRERVAEAARNMTGGSRRRHSLQQGYETLMTREGRQRMQELPDGSIVLPQHVAYQGITPPKGRREHFTGHFHTGDDESRALDFGSYTEFQWGLLIQARPGVVDLANQVPFRWRDAGGVMRTHNFDFVAYMADAAPRSWSRRRCGCRAIACAGSSRPSRRRSPGISPTASS